MLHKTVLHAMEVEGNGLQKEARLVWSPEIPSPVSTFGDRMQGKWVLV